jgi:ABC-type multidrug transport system ATPase subunit
VSILYTSHRLLEIREIGDRVTVLRDGRKVGTLNVVEADEDTVVRMMVGRDIREMFPKTPVSRGSPVLTVRNLEVDGALRGVSFTVHAGEIVGIFGLRGSGRTTLARAIFGLSRLSGGEILANGTRINVASPEDAINHGIGYATEDRREGLVPMLGLPPNITLASLDGVTRAGIIDHREEQRIGAGLVEELRIQPPVLSRPVRLLSGGNQQKVVLAKWLAGKSRVLIFDEPTRGIDVGAKTEVFHADGSLAMIEGACPVDYGYDARLEVLGTEGVVRVGDLDHGAVVTCTKASGVQSAPFASWRDRFRDAYVAEARHFADCVRGEATSLATGVDGRKALEATIAANRSSRLGVPVSLPLAPGAGEGHT